MQDGITVKNRTYTYDETHWLKTIIDSAGSSGSISYDYDNNGNTLSKMDGTASENTSTVFTVMGANY